MNYKQFDSWYLNYIYSFHSNFVRPIGSVNEKCRLGNNRLPDDDCRFLPKKNQNTRTSLMSYSFLSTVCSICYFILFH